MTESTVPETSTSAPISKWSWSAPATPLPPQTPLGQIVKTRSFLYAQLGFLSVMLLLFWPLLKGDALSSGAQTVLSPPFINPDSIDAAPYVNGWTGDFVRQFQWFEEYQYRAAKQGRFPTWNPDIFMGQPFHADGQSAMLFPTHWLFFLVDPNVARGPMTILGLMISATAVYILLRKFSLAPSASFVGGAVWILGSFNMHWLFWPQSNASLAAPLVLLAVDYLLLKPTWRGYAITSLATAPLFLSGHPEGELLAGVMIAIYIAFRLLGLLFGGLTIRQIIIAGCVVSAAIVTGLIMASASVLPLWIQIHHSFEFLDPAGHRGAAGGKPEIVPWNTLWLFLIPEYFGRPRGAFPGFEYNGAYNYIEATLWFGAMGLILAMASVVSTFLPRFGSKVDKWRDRFSFLPVFSIFTLTFTLMVFFCVWPVFQIVVSLPAMDQIALKRISLASQLTGAMLAAYAVHQILVRKDRTLATIAGILSVVACAAVIHSVYVRWDEIQLAWMQAIASVTRMSPQWPRVASSMIEQYAGFRMILGAFLLLIGTAVTLGVVGATLRRKEVSPTLQFLFVAIITLDALLPSYDFNPVTPTKFIVPPTPPILQDMILQTGDGRMLGLDLLLDPNISMHYGFRDVRGYDLPHNLRLVRLFKRLEIDKSDNHGLFDISRFYPYIHPDVAAYLDRSCVRNLMIYIPDPNAQKALSSLKLINGFESPGHMNWPQTAATGDGTMVFTNPNSYPRTYLAKTADFIADPQAAMDVLLDDKSDLRDRSVYEDAQAPYPAVQATDSSADTSAITRDNPEQVVIDSQTASQRLLVLEDRMDDGWEVTIDGKFAEALTANYLFRGVFVPAGHHTVEWTYHAPGLVTGVTMSGVSTIAMLGLLIGTSFRRRKFELPSAMVPVSPEPIA